MNESRSSGSDNRQRKRRSLSWARQVGLWFCCLTLVALQGCAINRESASASPDVDLSRLKSLHVVKSAADERGTDKVIAAELTKLGFQASTGLDTATPKDVDAIVTYQAKWHWDITMYLLELRIFMREPQTERLLAMGASMHTSLTRKPADAMAAEVLTNMLRGAKATVPSNE